MQGFAKAPSQDCSKTPGDQHQRDQRQNIPVAEIMAARQTPSERPTWRRGIAA